MHPSLLHNQVGLARAFGSSAALSLALGACARTAPPPAYEAVQRDEAEIARGSAQLETAASCPDAQAAAEAVCHAQGALCDRTAGTEDADAKARCDRAANLCSAARTLASNQCAEPSKATTP